MAKTMLLYEGFLGLVCDWEMDVLRDSCVGRGRAYRPPSANIPNSWILEVRETCNRHRLGMGKDRIAVSVMMLSMLISGQFLKPAFVGLECLTRSL